jgi:hypothetical protein
MHEKKRSIISQRMQEIDDERFERLGVRPNMTMAECVAKMMHDLTLAIIETDHRQVH